MNGGTCEDAISNYICLCAVGFTGRNCETNIDDCQPNPCGLGTCLDGINMFSCNCTGTGFTGDNCNDNINECTSLELPCSNNGNCTDEIGTFECECFGGFQGDRCEEIIPPDSEDDNDITALAIGIAVGLVLVTILLGLIVAYVAYRQHRNNKYSGSYSPRSAEIANGRRGDDETDSAGKTERLI